MQMMVMKVVETMRGNMVKRVISSMMYCNAERDRREKVRDINREEK